MAIRTTDEQVGLVISVASGAVLTPFIEVASSLVDEHCVGGDLSDARLTLIETWLAAHFYAIQDPRAKRESIGAASQSFDWKVDMYLETTRYGQQAMLLDSTGGLTNLNAKAKRKNVGFVWMGKEETT